METQLLSLDQEMETLLSRIADITGNAGPSNVEIARFGHTTEGFAVNGSANRYSDVYLYAAAMRSSPNFDYAVVIQVASSGDAKFGFTVEVTIPVPAPEEEEGAETQAKSP